MFEELRDMNNNIRRKQERIEELRVLATTTSISTGDKVQSSVNPDRLSDIVCKIVILENELETMIDDYADIKMQTKEMIFTLDNEDWQDILYSHYVEFEPWSSIARRKHSNVKAVMQKKKRAIKKLKNTTCSEQMC